MTSRPLRSPNTLPASARDRSVTRELDQQIGRELRTLYDEVLAEPIPDRFIALIESFSPGQDTKVQIDSEEVDA